MLNRIVLVLVIVPVAVVLIALAVATRGAVPFTLDPFNPGNKALTVEWPLFIYLFVTLVAGMVIGSVATWRTQGHSRTEARSQGRDVPRGGRATPRRARPRRRFRPLRRRRLP